MAFLFSEQRWSVHYISVEHGKYPNITPRPSETSTPRQGPRIRTVKVTFRNPTNQSIEPIRHSLQTLNHEFLPFQLRGGELTILGEQGSSNRTYTHAEQRKEGIDLTGAALNHIVLFRSTRRVRRRQKGPMAWINKSAMFIYICIHTCTRVI